MEFAKIKDIDVIFNKILSQPVNLFRLDKEYFKKYTEKGLTVANKSDDSFFALCVFPSPPYGWLNIATINYDILLKSLPLAIKILKSKLKDGKIEYLRIGLDKRKYSDLILLLKSIGFKEVMRILIFEKYDFSIPKYGNQEVVIRNADERDISALIEIDSLCFDKEFSFDEETFRTVITRPSFYVAELHGNVVGYLYLRAGKKIGHYIRVAVHPEFQNMGIGTRLTAFAIEYFKEKGVSTIFLRTLEKLKSAIRLYKKFNFKYVGDEILLEFKV